MYSFNRYQPLHVIIIMLNIMPTNDDVMTVAGWLMSCPMDVIWIEFGGLSDDLLFIMFEQGSAR